MRKLCIFAMLLCVWSMNSSAQDCQYEEVYLNISSWHTDLIIKAKNFPELESLYPGYEYVVVGFGDEEFWKAGAFFDKSKFEQFSTAFDSLLLPSKGVMSVYGMSRDPRQFAEEVIRFKPTDLERVVKYIRNSFELNKYDELILIDTIDGVDLYQSSMNYSVLRTCNSWTAESLSEASNFNFSALTSNIVKRTLERARIPKDKRMEGCATHRKSTRRSRRDHQRTLNLGNK